MTRPISVHPISALIGLALGAVCFIAMGQASQPADSWPPQKRNIVNVYEMLSPSLSIPPDGSVTVFDVPSDRWLTVTGVSSGNNGFLLWAEEL